MELLDGVKNYLTISREQRGHYQVTPAMAELFDISPETTVNDLDDDQLLQVLFIESQFELSRLSQPKTVMNRQARRARARKVATKSQPSSTVARRKSH